MIMRANNTVSGKMAEMRAYGFSGNRPYHFSRIYLRPCAIKMVNGKIKKMTALELNPVIMTLKMSNNVAIELRDAKKPLVVEKMPISAITKVGRLINGARIMLSALPRHEKIGATPVVRLCQKSPRLKFLANNNSIMVSGWLMVLMMSAVIPATIAMQVRINGIFGSDLIMKRRCGCKKTNRIQNTAK